MAAPYFGYNFAVGYGLPYSVPYGSNLSGHSQIYSMPPVALTSPEPKPERNEPARFVPLTAKDCLLTIKSVEDSVSSAYNTLELEHYKINQTKSEDYTSLFHLAASKLLSGRLRYEAVKDKLPTGNSPAEETSKSSVDFSEEEMEKYFPPTPPSSEHPFEELKALRFKVNALRKILEIKVKAELNTK
jgi:hypothetical protein